MDILKQTLEIRQKMAVLWKEKREQGELIRHGYKDAKNKLFSIRRDIEALAKQVQRIYDNSQPCSMTYSEVLNYKEDLSQVNLKK